jgi:hypothetical protein
MGAGLWRYISWWPEHTTQYHGQGQPVSGRLRRIML